MNFEDLTRDLKQKLKAAKTEEELLAVIAAEGLDLSEDQLRGISGGFRPFGDMPIDPDDLTPYCYENCQEDNNTTCWGHSDS